MFLHVEAVRALSILLKQFSFITRRQGDSNSRNLRHLPRGATAVFSHVH